MTMMARENSALCDPRWKNYGTARNWAVYDSWQHLKNFAQVGREFRLSRDRVRVIVTILGYRLQDGSIKIHQIEGEA